MVDDLYKVLASKSLMVVIRTSSACLIKPNLQICFPYKIGLYKDLERSTHSCDLFVADNLYHSKLSLKEKHVNVMFPLLMITAHIFSLKWIPMSQTWHTMMADKKVLELSTAIRVKIAIRFKSWERMASKRLHTKQSLSSNAIITSSEHKLYFVPCQFYYQVTVC